MQKVYDELVFPIDFYLEHLEVINNIKLTPREIDIISCVMHGKNPKGIARFLSTEHKTISERSVETHILNIRRKIGGGTRESIINFIEKSEKRPLLFKYYDCLLLQQEFDTSLKQIRALIKPNNLSFLIVLCSEQSQAEATLNPNIQFASNLINHLQFLGCKVEQITQRTDNNFIPTTMDSDKDQNIIYIFPRDIRNIHTTAHINSSLSRKIICLVSEEIQQDSKLLDQIQYINVSQQPNYYLLFLKVIQQSFKDIESEVLDAIIAKFTKSSENVALSAPHNNIDTSDVKISLNVPNSNDTSNSWSTKTWPKMVVTLKNWTNPLLFLIIPFIVLGIDKALEYSKFTTNTHIESVAQINHITEKVVATCSTNNITKIDKENNLRYATQIERITRDLQNRQIYDYYSSSTVPPEQLINLLYSLVVLSNYYNINNHDGEKARLILSDAKKLAEGYIVSRSRISFDFASLSTEQIYAEIKDFPDLREMYTIIIYLTGRTYTYQGNRNESIKYFELARYLGNKFKLFEGYLSNRGIARAQKRRIVEDIKNKDYKTAIHKINEAITLYKSLKQDNTEYQDSYRPASVQGITKYNKVIPQHDIYNQVECAEEIAKYYLFLILLDIQSTQDNQDIRSSNNLNTEQHKIAEYAREISNQFIGDKTSPGMLQLLNKLESKKIACIYNVLGSILMFLYDNRIECTKFTEAIYKELYSQASNTEPIPIGILRSPDNKDSAIDSLSILEIIFTLSEKLSRQGDYTKADAYNGLINTYERILKRSDYTQAKLSIEQKSVLQERIIKYTKAKDIINEALKRTTTQNSILDVVTR